MYDFLLHQWLHGKITEEKLKTYCPLYITKEQLKEILGRKQLV